MVDFPVMPPHEAGARIRVLATQILTALNKPPVSTPQMFQTTMAIQEAWDRVMSAKITLNAAITSRRSTLMRPALEAYEHAVRDHRNLVYQSASDQIVQKKLNYQMTVEGITVHEAIDQLRMLANNLPSQPDLPSADSRDTALRAIIAVLRTHNVPGTETLTHHAKEDPNAKTETVGDKAASQSVASAILSAAKDAGIGAIPTKLPDSAI